MPVSPTPFKPGDKLVIRGSERPEHNLPDGETCEVQERNSNGNYRVKTAGGTVIPSVPHDALEIAPPPPPPGPV